MNEHERSICEAIEAMLFTATGRQAIGSVDDVLFRIICNSEFASMAKYPSDGLGTEDAKTLANALWCVIASIQVDEPLGIVSTIPCISGESTRSEFAETWAWQLHCVIPKVGKPDYRGVLSTKADVRDRFEESLVIVVAHFCVREECNISFSFRSTLRMMNEYCNALGDPARISNVCECLLNVMANVEDHSGV